MALSESDVHGIIQIDSELNKIQDVDLLLERVLLEARRVVNAEAGTIYVKDGDHLHFRYTQNDFLQRKLAPGQKLIYATFTVPISEKTIAGYVAKTGELVSIPDVYAIPKSAPYSYSTYFDKTSLYKTTSMLTLPLNTSTGGLLGVIQVLNAKDDAGISIPFTREDEVLVTHFAANATVALQRAYQTRNMIRRMNMTAELRDTHETAVHVYRVSGYAAEIYERWAFNHGIPEPDREKTKDTLKLATMLHDIGKVAISDLILKKPSRFTEEEYSIMQAHTFCGAKLFSDAETDFDRMAADIALTHHERWDGTGYPGRVNAALAKPELKRISVEGVTREVEVWNAPVIELAGDGRPRRLKGEEIPLAGRIVAVADVFDALASRRVYKEVWDLERVANEIRSQAGKQFDPEIVVAFEQVRPSIEQVRSQYPDKSDT